MNNNQPEDNRPSNNGSTILNEEIIELKAGSMKRAQ